MNKTWFTLVTLMFLCLLNVCECETCGTIRARRVWKFVEEGGSLKLSCEVQHCGLSSWTGGWTFQGKQGTSFTPLNSTERISLSNSSAASSSHLIVSIHNVNQSDAGAYRCKVIWPQSIMSYGHVTYVNVTPVTESHLDSSGRSVAIKVLLCLGSLFLLLFVLGFVWCLTQNHQSPPPVPPRTSCKSQLSVLSLSLFFMTISSYTQKRFQDSSRVNFSV
ncbi:hypothetical protein DNTS_010867 [Danionella cerebrum]|uniref:Ig-like domain-containing protein n=1 Tax=Danionella cerebrum TaxID=2873325 RepID=A0A553NL80_9TELE|nr:hypothetical protein DNTS_010867 [Danionella translucida]